MPARIERSEQEKRDAILEQKRKCYRKHKAIYSLQSIKNYYVKALSTKSLNDKKIEKYNKKIEEINNKLQILQSK